MIIKKIYPGTPQNNFNYLVACPKTGEALAIDPDDLGECLRTAQQEHWRITHIVNTHEHQDHIGGNAAIMETFGAKLLAHPKASRFIPNMDRGLKQGEVISIGETIRLSVLEAPGHTPFHLCLFASGKENVLFCGDTLFNAGVGNCYSGDPHILFQTFSEKIFPLPEDTFVYPGHHYIETNLAFTLSIEPKNESAKKLLAKIQGEDPHQAFVTTLALEKKVNTFFRLQNPSIVSGLKNRGYLRNGSPSPKDVFLTLRSLRNQW